MTETPGLMAMTLEPVQRIRMGRSTVLTAELMAKLPARMGCPRVIRIRKGLPRVTPTRPLMTTKTEEPKLTLTANRKAPPSPRRDPEASPGAYPTAAPTYRRPRSWTYPPAGTLDANRLPG